MRCFCLFLVLAYIAVFPGIIKADEQIDSSHVQGKAPEGEKEVSAVKEDYSLVPSIISESLQLYREEGPESFIKSILKGSPLEVDTTGSTEELGRLKRVERYYGKMMTHKFINMLKLGEWYKRIYIVIQFEKGPVFCRIDCYYTAKNTWIINDYTFNTNIEKVFPDSLLKQYFEDKLN